MVTWLRKMFGAPASHAVTIAPLGVRCVVPKGETILERALKDGIAFPHDCTVGSCGSCRSKLIEGKVEAITPFSYTLSREELEAGYILACQAIAKTDLVIEVDLPSAPAAEVVQRRARLTGLDPMEYPLADGTIGYGLGECGFRFPRAGNGEDDAALTARRVIGQVTDIAY